MTKTEHTAGSNRVFVEFARESDTESSERIFTAGERTLFHNRAPHKRREFILGRLAAKRAIAGYAKRLYGLEIKTADCAILMRKDGRPGVVITEGSVSKNFVPPLVSISHTRGVGAVALVAQASDYNGVGIDIEKIRYFSDATSRAFMTKRERIFFESISLGNRPRIATILWTLKEAYLKALGVGLRIHPGRIDVLPFLNERFSRTSQVTGGWTEVNEETILSRIFIV